MFTFREIFAIVWHANIKIIQFERSVEYNDLIQDDETFFYSKLHGSIQDIPSYLPLYSGPARARAHFPGKPYNAD